MKLSRSFSPDTIKPRLESRKKKKVIEELLDVLEASGKISNRKAALKAILEREKKMSTGLQHGVAIPHGRTDTVENLVAAIGLAPDGVDFEAMDKKPSQIFVLTLSPNNRNGPHIEFLGAVNRLLVNEDRRSALLGCETREEISAVFESFDEAKDESGEAPP